MRLRFREPGIWLGIVESIEKMLDEGVFLAEPSGIYLRALDVSHVTMVDLYFPKEAFLEFEAESREEIPVSFGVLSKVLRRAGRRSELIMESSEGSLTVEFVGRGRRSFKIPQAGLTYDKLPEPRINFTVRAKMMGGPFVEVVKAVAAVSEVIELKASEDKLIVSGEGDIVRKVSVELVPGTQSLLELEAESNDRARYSTEYFTYMVPAARHAESVTIQFAEDSPVRVDFLHAGGGRLTIYVSPRAE
ncbi:MAG: DNA polymerase III sliding clamp [Acidilobaceae archaeon]|nr:DNA polymerase III sliding clamp [Acidilobaceae archaeon]